METLCKLFFLLQKSKSLGGCLKYFSGTNYMSRNKISLFNGTAVKAVCGGLPI